MHESLDELLSLPNLVILNPSIDIESQKDVIKYMTQYSLKPRDAYHLKVCLDNDVEYFATFDNDFKKVFEGGVLLKF